MSNFELQGTRLSDSSEDESSVVESEPSRKRLHSEFILDGTESSEDESSLEPPRKRVRNLDGTDRSSTDHSLPVDDFQLSDDEDSPVQHTETNLMDNMVKLAKSESFFDPKGQKMMERMGYRAGHGLGKHGQGRVDPVEMSLHRGRRGLGLHIKGLEAATLKWNSNLEVISVEETVSWLEDMSHETLTQDVLHAWIKEGSKKETIDDETNFCDPNLLKNVLDSKSVFDKLQPEEMQRARTRSNPFETIRGAFFLNRAAMKMANMDRVFDFMFTKPKGEHNEEVVGPSDLLYFADVCAGPGGFSEYVLWRRSWKAKGFGFTLKHENDFRLQDFYAGPCETFEPHYGHNGVDGDGDIYKPDNITDFSKFVMDHTHNIGVHFMMADGGFSVDGKENIQEILSKQLYLCQFLVALLIVRKGGNFVCKLFDLFTPFSVGLVYLMYKSFQRISIHKPNTSRPANSERYIICQWKREDCKDIADYLYHVNELLCKFSSASNSNRDIVEVVPLEVLTSDDNFFNYIVCSNNSLGERQVVNLVKIAAFCRDTNLVETQQAEMKRQCLSYWEVPDKVRTAPPRVAPETKCDDILKKIKAGPSGLLSAKESELGPEILEHVFKSVYDWHCIVLGSSRDKKDCSFYLGLGRNRVFRLDGNRWLKVDHLELSPDTLLYGEIVMELRGEGRSQCKFTTLHIIDAIFLGGIDISGEHLTLRNKLCSQFAEALNKDSRLDLTSIHVKKLYDLEFVEEIFDKLNQRMIKGTGGSYRLAYETGDRFFLPHGLMFLKATQEPWMRHMSRSTHLHYYFSPFKKDSKFDKDRPKEACSSTLNCFKNRHIWWWEQGVKVHDSHTAEQGKLQRDQLLSFVHRKCIHRTEMR
ncbi:cap-specific mRNA (nucleoside-2'-O-)-methyltransferase 1 [Zootermopsis nevadensis]|uniref:Cap-specific mRNA (nucleoside-2'-O-)-methyltransferase 1 n=1 Tax=Zootermopsis nevadensis TaxID=136037 RepID=A0A067R9R9_ZOONE|nr:cap-specific mRNA (nucleoside-2'-O-)-methyltransferase 1 [Zootermopsis nevadensis]KDR15308.1 S-adenosyl-L-methionine-dependent methyltransferase ftsjd2 [Zootermopsis nevadensis]